MWWVSLQFVIVVFPDHTHVLLELYEKYQILFFKLLCNDTLLLLLLLCVWGEGVRWRGRQGQHHPGVECLSTVSYLHLHKWF